jgi:hypothetical protein
MEDELILAALRMAISRRIIQPGLIHHSDRGSQYASKNCTDLLKGQGIEISMSRKANPWDNASCESFIETLKYEEVHRNEYRDLSQARAVSTFLEKVYNQKRLHSELRYLPPSEFERNPVVPVWTRQTALAPDTNRHSCRLAGRVAGETGRSIVLTSEEAVKFATRPSKAATYGSRYQYCGGGRTSPFPKGVCFTSLYRLNDLKCRRT